ncbi:hypothetical protein AB0L70_18410 [Kribbella sp. NPDC051952]|uniref:hypothetical protein n=1 Tax=Kribbella sp. NPDC051952 TaxID=3154851 RepID=UPI003447854E
MSRAKRAIHQRRGPLLLVVGVVAAVTVAAGVALAQLGGPSDQPTGQPTLSTTHPAHNASHAASAPTSGPATNEPAKPAASQPAKPATPQPKPKVIKSAADACADEIRTTEAVVTSAWAAAEHWRQHVQARTDLLSGKNSEEATKAIWKRTRLAGPADIATLDSAVSAQAKAAGGCKKLSGTTATVCKKRLSALDRAAKADRAAAGDWESHLSMMAAHAAGDFDAEHAQDMWVAAWTAAPKHLDAASRANAALTAAPDCPS